MEFLQIRIDPTDFIEGIENVIQATRSANYIAAAHIRDGLNSIIMGTFYTALGEAGSGFPDIYAAHLRISIREFLYPEVTVTADGLVAQVGDIESLFDFEAYEEATHYHALAALEEGENFSVSNPTRIGFPYMGEDLYNDREKRLDYWEHMVRGEPYDVTFGVGGTKPGKNGRLPPVHTKTFQTTGQYDETLTARVRWWGDRYPEWYMLDNGISEYPSVRATHVSYFMEQNCYRYMEEIYQEVFNSILDTWDSAKGQSYKLTENPDLILDPRGKGSKARSISTGRFG